MTDVIRPPMGSDPLGDAVRDAVDAIKRASEILGPPADPLTAAAGSALECASALMDLHQREEHANGAMHDALGAARALVGEVAFAIRDRYGADNG